MQLRILALFYRHHQLDFTTVYVWYPIVFLLIQKATLIALIPALAPIKFQLVCFNVKY